jgi:hypothetical protein
MNNKTSFDLPSFTDDIVSIIPIHYKQDCLSKIKRLIEESPDNLLMRRTYVSMLKFFDSNEKELLTVDTFSKWADLSGELDLISPKEMELFLTTINPFLLINFSKAEEAKHERTL